MRRIKPVPAKAKKAVKVKTAAKKAPARGQSARSPAKKTARSPSTSPAANPVSNNSGDGTVGLRWTLQGGEVGIRVRMYRVGFGDFFLVTFQPVEGDQVHVIIDCGVFKGTSQTGDIGTIEAAIADMLQTTQKRVALIMVTHRHADHIAGFARRQSDFKLLAVQAIWMSIWESQYAGAVKLQAELDRTSKALQLHFTGLGAAASADQDTARKYMENAQGEIGNGSNANALALLKGGIGGLEPDYYQAGQIPTLPAAFTQLGIGAKILGPPPIDDVPLMKLMDLQKGIGQYMVRVGAAPTGVDPPFGEAWEVDPDNFYPTGAFAEWLDRKNPVAPDEIDLMRARKKMERILKSAQPDAALVAAAQLNSFLNNQSLVVLFTFKGKNLLFVGDAQAGNWEHWIFGTDDPDKTASKSLTPDAQELLTSLDFYKVGHHGSSNATPKTVVTTMGKSAHKFAAMCSTQKGVYGKENIGDPSVGTEVPRIPLISALEGISTLVRSDQLAIKEGAIQEPAAVADPLPTDSAAGRFVPGAFWVDCFL
jgi:beta-lactamase superfamily II metal-dependent hydrolase